jgi:hypothetical protein
MKTTDNFGRPSAEMNTLFRQDGAVINVNTTYVDGRIGFQTVSTRTPDGKVSTETVRNGKLLP